VAQNPEIRVGNWDIIPKFTYETKRHTRNIVIEVSAQTRRKLIDNKVKIGWITVAYTTTCLPPDASDVLDSTTE